MSWLFTRPEGMDDFVNVRATMMEGADSYSPFIETYTSEKLSRAVTPAVHSYNKVPSPDDFAALFAEFSN